MDVRIVAATSAALWRMVEDGRFSLDLFHRLAVLVVQLPALHEVPEDAVALAHHFARRLGCGVDRSGEPWIAAQDWPGNGRELENLLIRASVRWPRARLSAEQLAAVALRRPGVAPVAPGPAAGAEDSGARRERVERALVASGGNRAQAARAIGMTLSELLWAIRTLGIPVSRRKAGRPGTPAAGAGESVVESRAIDFEPPPAIDCAAEPTADDRGGN